MRTVITIDDDAMILTTHNDDDSHMISHIFPKREINFANAPFSVIKDIVRAQEWKIYEFSKKENV